MHRAELADGSPQHHPETIKIGELELSRRAVHACRALNVATIADFLARARLEFLAVRNCGPATYRHIEQRVRARLADRMRARAPENTLLPPGLRELAVAELRLDQAMAAELERLALDSVGQLLALQDPHACLGGELAEAVRAALDRLLAAGLQLPRPPSRSEPGQAARVGTAASEYLPPRPISVSDRAYEILSDAPEPLLLEDLVFRYRDRFRACHSGRLLGHLRADARLLQIGHSVWTLRDRCTEELASIAEQSHQLAAAITTRGERQSVAELTSDMALSGRQLFLLLDCLRTNPALRDLGRGDFCPRNQRVSGVLKHIIAQLTRAMGELRVERFLDNQDGRRRVVIEQLLQENRLFVQPGEDRVDLLSNYPFAQGRLAQFCAAIDGYLDRVNGYARLADVLAHIQRSVFAGSYLNEYLIGDLLRRQGRFDVLPGGIIAQSRLALAGWLQRKARDVLRGCDTPITTGEIIAELPALAEFGASLPALLDRDPLIHSNDDVHYRLS